MPRWSSRSRLAGALHRQARGRGDTSLDGQAASATASAIVPARAAARRRGTERLVPKKILPRGFEPRTTACLSAAKRAVHRGNVPLDLYKHRVINQLDDGRRSSKPAAILLSSVGHRMTASSHGALSAHERPSRLTLAHGLRMRPPVLSRYAAPAWKEAHARSSVCDPAASSRRCLVLRRSGRLS